MHRRTTTSPDRGATAVEYALIIALVLGVVVALMATVGSQIFNLYSTVPHF